MQIVKRNSIVIFFASFILITIAYRIEFIFASSINQKIIPPYVIYQYIVSGILGDLLLGITIAMSFFILQSTYKKLKVNNIAFVIENILFCLILFFITLIYITHEKLVTLFFIGINHSLLLNVLQHRVSLNVGIPYLNLSEWILIFSPFILFFTLSTFAYRYAANIIIYGVGLILSIFAISKIIAMTWIPFTYETYMFSLLRTNPVILLIEDSWKNMTNIYVKRQDFPGTDQRHTIKLMDPIFVNNKPGSQLVLTTLKNEKPMNVVIFVLESVSSKYIFSKSEEHPTPMPFLESLSHKGLWLNNNYSSGNRSSLGIFGIFTGIYPKPTQEALELRPHIAIPSLANWLGDSYDKLLVTPTSTLLYFPKGLFRSFTKLYSPENIPHNQHKLLLNTYLPESYGFEFFLSQLSQMHEPFLSVYMSAAAHYPYFENGSNSQIAIPTNIAYNRYINNLRLLDQEIKFLYQFLDKKNLLKNTLLIIVSDHGEGFGQHDGSWIHSNTVYDEQIKTPLLFINSKIFKPQTINEVTSNIDILPTVIDALGISYNPRNLQGRSFLKSDLLRKYIFVYGGENELAAIDNKKNKMIIDFTLGVCKMFNLKTDADELHPLPCLHSDQEHAIVAFKNYQSDLLNWYSLKAY